MKKSFIVLFVLVLSVFMLVSCATKAKATSQPEVAEPVAAQQPAESDVITLNFPYIMKTYTPEGQNCEFLDIAVAYDPERDLKWNPWYNNEEAQTYLEFVGHSTGTYDFEAGTRPVQLFTFKALKPAEYVIFGLDLKDTNGKIISEIAIAAGIDENLKITILDNKSIQPEN